MLDINLYRENEDLHARFLNNWREKARHSLDVFEKNGFPVRVKNIAHLRQILNTMSEGSYDLIMDELGGLSENEIEIFVSVAINILKFQRQHFDARPLIVPFENMLINLLLYRHIMEIPNQDILEIGPGNGLLAFYLKNHNEINYHQVEACESFYILNHYQNTYLYGDMFRQAASEVNFSSNGFYTRNNDAYIPREQYIESVNGRKRCVQYPWWKLNDLRNSDKSYDIIFSNANLLEFSVDALLDYLELILKKLKPSGVFIVYGFGNPTYFDVDHLMFVLYNHEFAPIFMRRKNLDVPKGDYTDKIVILMPASRENRLLVTDFNFTAQFKEVLIYDDNVAGNIGGCRCISGAELENESIDYYLIRTQSDTIRQKMLEVAALLSTAEELSDVSGKWVAARDWGVFVRKGHELFEKGYNVANFQSYFHLPEAGRYGFPAKRSNGRVRYTKQELLLKIENAWKENDFA
jgi:SAM-dependent methyltransferase